MVCLKDCPSCNNGHVNKDGLSNNLSFEDNFRSWSQMLRKVSALSIICTYVFAITFACCCDQSAFVLSITS
jgi:hypothetical protein